MEGPKRRGIWKTEMSKTENGAGAGFKKHRIEHWQLISFFLVLFDIAAIAFSYFFALLLRFDVKYSSIPSQYMDRFLRSIWIYIAICIVVFFIMKLYRSIWRFASYAELYRVFISSGITLVLHILLMNCFFGSMPILYFVFGIFCQTLLVLGIRFSYRFVFLLRGRNNDAEGRKNVMLIGAGTTGRGLITDIKTATDLNERICCLIDDNPNKWGRFIDRVKVVGGRESIPENVEKYQIDKIYLAIPNATALQRKEIIDICKETGCEMKIFPSAAQLSSGKVRVSAMKEVAIEDLLGREPVKVNLEEIVGYVQSKTVLVTGGGGSIGSELCRQIAKHNPKLLVVFDVYENNTYDIQLELRNNYPNVRAEFIIGSVRDSRKVWKLFETYRPDIVYHAAAHKHVPLMEDSPCEAIKNNAIGTYKTAYAAMVYGTQRFVLISTDKAVNPTNIMGASKRICEMVIQAFDRKIRDGKAHELPQLFTHWIREAHADLATEEALRNVKTEFVAVRFGNVLGSNGSVIPLFRKQIAKGGPVTVTHPDIIRYFMTIPEAVSLVLQAGSYAKGGEIFVLDMGEPVKIDTLARNLIRLSGYKPDVDIKVVYTGLRPGEKLYEEKLMAEEGMTKTDNDLIHIGKPIAFDTDQFLVQLNELMIAAYNNSDKIREMVQEIVVNYQPS